MLSHGHHDDAAGTVSIDYSFQYATMTIGLAFRGMIRLYIYHNVDPIWTQITHKPDLPSHLGINTICKP